jgi:hypothetical protein
LCYRGSSADAADEAKRVMNVRQGPESVFAVDPGELFSDLAGATATGANGRVGDELVFWGYRLGDGRSVFLVACLMTATVDCAVREARVCLGDSAVLARTTSAGRVRRVQCSSIGLVAPGDLRPGCTDRETSDQLALSLLQCT